jgi:uncharacterized protein (DUF433 family)
MQFEDYFEIWGPDDIRLKGHRIALEDVLDLYVAGMSAERIAAYFGTLTLEHVQAVIAYYQSHRDELAAYLERQDAYTTARTQHAEAHPSQGALRMHALRAERQRASAS